MRSNFKAVPNQIGRREALRLTARTALAAAGTVVIGRCKGTTTPDPEPPPPDPVEVRVRFYNHTQGYLGEKAYTGQAGTPLTVSVADCPDTTTVHPNRLAVREAVSNGWLGKLVEYSRTGQLLYANFPSRDSQYDAFLMNKINGADYDLIDNHPSGYGGRTFHSPNASWFRDDIDCGGPEEPLREAMRQISEALIFPWAKYMGFTEIYSPADLIVGYRCFADPPGSLYRGYANSFQAWANPTACQDQGHSFLLVFLEQIFKHLTGCLFAFEVAPTGLLTYQYITDGSAINAVGRDLLAYVPVMDSRNA